MSHVTNIIALEDDEEGKLYKVVHNDNDEEEIDYAEMKGLLTKHADLTFNRIVDCIVPAFDYLENCLSGKCKST